MQERNRLLAQSARNVRLDHVALNRSRPDQGNTCNYVLDVVCLKSGLKRSLCRALELEDTYRLTPVKHLVSGLVVIGDRIIVKRRIPFPDQLYAVLYRRQGPQAKQVQFDQAKLFDIVLVKLSYHNALCRLLQRGDIQQRLT